MVDFRDAWTAELDRLELDVALAERLLKSAELKLLPEWIEPVMRGPLPSDLVPRARLILERQLAVAHKLTARVASTQKHQALNERLRDNMAPDVPVYVDLTA
jgi:hypothetical protein